MNGQQLGHYRIVEEIGAGGMGVVYRAHDEQLDRDVALKVLPAGMLVDEAARRQFRKEALALAKLNHPNIETVFEFSTQGEVDFLAMELIPGSSLGERLKTGPLAEKEVLRLGMQLAEGLAAAHDQGVIHRDLKPGNLFITPDGRLKVLDFGLAKLLHAEPAGDLTRSVTTESGAISGTVPYMSPEQLRGLPVDVRSDIYAAGAVLFEMATGRRPFPQSQSAELMGAILHEVPPPVRSVNPRISPGIQNVIAKTLEKKPERRYQSARELHAALEAQSTSAPFFGAAAEPGADAQAAVRWKVGAGAVALTALLAVGLVLGLNVRGMRDRLWGRNGSGGANSASAGLAPIQARRSVAVIGFKNLSGRPDEAWLATALSEMLTTELAAGGKLRTVPGETVAQMKTSLSLPEADSYGTATLAKIRRNVGADEIVLGSYLALGNGQVRVDLKVEDAASGGIVDSVTVNGAETEVSDLISRAGVSLRDKLGAGEISSSQAAAVKASLPSNPEAARLYSEGLAKMRAYDNLAARDLLQKAIGTEPGFALAHSALATAWRTLGYDSKAREEAKKAFDLSASLGSEEQLWVEGQYREMADELDKAVDCYRTLFQASPDNLEYGLRLAYVQYHAGKAQDAQATLDLLRKLPPPANDDPRIDIREADAADKLGDYKRETAAADRAVKKARAQGARLLAAQALLEKCWGLKILGQPKEAIATCEEAQGIFAEAGDRDHVASALDQVAGILEEQGDYAAAKVKFEQALAISSAVGDRDSVAVELGNMANLLSAWGDLREAQKLYERTIAAYREIGDKDNVSLTLSNLGGLLDSMGDLSGAQTELEESLAIARETGNAGQQAFDLSVLGDVLLYRGDLAGASDALQRAEAALRDAGDKRDDAATLFNWGKVLLAQGDLAGARKKHQDALNIRTEIGAKEEAALSQVFLAALVMEEGRSAGVEAPLRQSIQELRAEKDTDDELLAHAVLVRVLLAAGKTSDAQREIDGAGTLVAKSQNRGNRMEMAIAAARVRAASGKFSEAEKSLQATLGEATRSGDVYHEFEARMALGEIEMQSGKTAAGRARLTALEKDATAKGFLLIARKAHGAAAAAKAPRIFGVKSTVADPKGFVLCDEYIATDRQALAALTGYN
jgi:tetratricopeptide (TPR) repeat protein/TolB-like protein